MPFTNKFGTFSLRLTGVHTSKPCRTRPPIGACQGKLRRLEENLPTMQQKDALPVRLLLCGTLSCFQWEMVGWLVEQTFQWEMIQTKTPRNGRNFQDTRFGPPFVGRGFVSIWCNQLRCFWEDLLVVDENQLVDAIGLSCLGSYQLLYHLPSQQRSGKLSLIISNLNHDFVDMANHLNNGYY